MKTAFALLALTGISIFAIPTDSQQTPVFGGHTVFHNAQELYKMCTAQHSPAAPWVCTGYIQGAYDALEGKNIHLCLPSVNMDDIKNAFVNFLDTHLGFMRPDQPATAAMAVAFACKQ